MAGSTLQEWLNRNAYRAYPFEEDSDFTCVDGAQLPKSAVLDMRVCLLGTTDGDVSLKAASFLADGNVVLTFDFLGTDMSLSSMEPFERDGHSSIRLVCGRPEDMMEFASRDFVLKTPARLLRSRVVSIPFGIGVDTLSSGGPKVFGDVRVADGHNTSLDIVGNNLKLTIRKGLGKGVRCPGLTEAEVCDGAVLYYLNGQKADSDGSIQIRGGDGVSVSTGTYKGMPAVIVTTSASVNSFIYR